MRNKRKWLCILTAVCFSCCLAFAACDKEPENTAEFSGFTVARTATAEVGTEYVFETPAVTYGGDAADIVVSVQCGETIVAHDGKKVYLEKEGAYSVSYTASAGGAYETKITALTVQDGVGPIIRSSLPAGIKYNTSVKLDEYFSAKDISGGSITGYTVKDITSGEETALPDGQFDAEENVFRITDESVKSLRVTVGAKDTKNHVSSRSADVTMMPITDYGYYDFADLETGLTEISGLTVNFGANAKDTSVSVAEDGGKKAIKIAATTTSVNNVIKIRFDASVAGDFGNFSAIDAELKFVKYNLDGKPVANGGNAGLGGEFNYADGDAGNAFNYSGGAWKTFAFGKESAIAAVKNSGALELFVKPWAEQKVEIYVSSFRGRYGALIADGNAVDLTEKFGLSEGEFSAKFTPSGGTETAVANVKAFLPDSAGTLKIFVSKDGYRETQLTLNVAGAPYYGSYRFDDMSLYSSAVASGASSSENMEIGKQDGYTVLSGKVSATWPRFVITAPSLKSLADFDYFTVRYKLSYSSGGGVIGLQGTTGNVYNYPEHNDGAAPTDGEWKLSTWRKDKTNTNAEPTGQRVWDYIEKNGILNFSVYAFNGEKGAETSFTIAEIVGGYDDIESDGVTAVDLTKRYGEALTGAVYQPTVGEATELSAAELAAFVKAESGSLRLIFQKEGFRKSEIVVQYTVQ